MKTTLCAIMCSFMLPLIAMAQDELPDNTDRDELKINAFNLIVFEYVDVTYERLLNEEASFGIGVLVNVGNVDDAIDYYRRFSLTPFYRRYFSKGYASGFFVEGFGMLNSGDEDVYVFDEPPIGTVVSTNEKYTDFALGVSVGGKFITKRGFIAEIYGGVGRNFFNTDFSPEVVGRGGVSLGFRF